MKNLFFILAFLVITACSQSNIITDNENMIETLKSYEKQFISDKDYIEAKAQLNDNQRRTLACASENVVIHSVGFGFYEVFFFDSNDEMFSVGTYWYSTVNSVGWCNMLNQ